MGPVGRDLEPVGVGWSGVRVGVRVGPMGNRDWEVGDQGSGAALVRPGLGGRDVLQAMARTGIGVGSDWGRARPG